ncbi:hypothetical protein, partial [Arsukibacterium sp.]|uniref:hypothetical protein n=1 Tax=Arsukibacterium sp. TaxID=1977258 RepID=UPI0035659018
MPAVGSSAKNIFRSVFGAVQWSAPDWLLRLKQHAKSHPWRFWIVTLLVLVLLAAVVAGYHYYQQLPKPLQVSAEVVTPEIGHYQDDTEQPTPLLLKFKYDLASAVNPAQEQEPELGLELEPVLGSEQDMVRTSMPAPMLSAARLDLIGEVISDGVAISPAIPGK